MQTNQEDRLSAEVLAGHESSCLTIDEICAFQLELLLPEEADRVRSHLARCKSCSERLGSFENEDEDLRAGQARIDANARSIGPHASNSEEDRSSSHLRRGGFRGDALKIAAGILVLVIPVVVFFANRSAESPSGQESPLPFGLQIFDLDGNPVRGAEMSAGESGEDSVLIRTGAAVRLRAVAQPGSRFCVVEVLTQEVGKEGGPADLANVTFVDSELELNRDFTLPEVSDVSDYWVLAWPLELDEEEQEIREAVLEMSFAGTREDIREQLESKLQRRVVAEKLRIMPTRAELQSKVIGLRRLIEDAGLSLRSYERIESEGRVLLDALKRQRAMAATSSESIALWEIEELQGLLSIASSILENPDLIQTAMAPSTNSNIMLAFALDGLQKNPNATTEQWEKLLEGAKDCYRQRASISGSQGMLALEALDLIASIHYARGDVATSLQVMTELKDERKKTLGGHHPEYARTLFSYSAQLESFGASLWAWLYKKEAFDITLRSQVLEHGPANYLFRAWFMGIDLAKLSLELGKFDHAEKYFDWATRFASENEAALKSYGKQFRSYRAYAYLKHGQALHHLARNGADQGQREVLLGDARAQLEQASVLYEDLKRTESLLSVKLAIAKIELDRGNHQVARESFEEIQAAVARESDEPDPYRVICDLELARMEIAEGHLEAAAARLSKTFNEQEVLRASQDSTVARIFAERQFGLSQTAAMLASVYAAQGRVIDAVTALERGRSGTLLELIGNVDASKALGRSAENSGKAARENLQSGRAEEESNRSPRDRVDRLAVNAATRLTDPDTILGQGSPITGEELESLLATDECALFYSWTNEEVLVHFLSGQPSGRDQARTHSIARGLASTRRLREQITRSIRDLGIRPQSATIAIERASRRRESESRMLIHDLEQLCDQLLPSELRLQIEAHSLVTVIPDGPLCQFPIQALVIDAGETMGETRFVLDEYPQGFAYVASGSLLSYVRKNCRNSRSQSTDWSALCVGAVEYAEHDLQSEENELVRLAFKHGLRGMENGESIAADRFQLKDFPNSDFWLDRTGEIMRAAGGKVRLLRGPDATLEAVLNEAESFRVMHFATHGRTGNPFEPEAPGILLSRSHGESEPRSTSLSLHRLFGLKPQAWNRCQLAVLLTCESGRGSGDVFEQFSLPIGFHHAGVPSVLATLWRVDSEAAMQLGSQFYKEMDLKSLKGKSFAIRSAQKELKETMRDPYYWAPFVLMGDH